MTQTTHALGTASTHKALPPMERLAWIFFDRAEALVKRLGNLPGSPRAIHMILTWRYRLIKRLYRGGHRDV